MLWQLVRKVFSKSAYFSPPYKFCIWTFPKGYSEPTVAEENPANSGLVPPDASASVLGFLNFSDRRIPCSKLERERVLFL